MRGLRRRISALAIAMVMLVPVVSFAQVSDEKALGLLLEFVWDYFLRWALPIGLFILLLGWLVNRGSPAAPGGSGPKQPSQPGK